jgi:hypothetical protein
VLEIDIEQLAENALDLIQCLTKKVYATRLKKQLTVQIDRHNFFSLLSNMLLVIFLHSFGIFT